VVETNDISFSWTGDTFGFGGEVAEKLIDKIISIQRCSSQLMTARILIGKKILNIVSAYATQTCLPDDYILVRRLDRKHEMSKLLEVRNVSHSTSCLLETL